MKDQAVTLTQSATDTAVLGLMLQQAVALAEKAANDESKPADVRLGALVATAKGHHLLHKVADALKQVVERVEDEKKKEEETPEPRSHVLGILFGQVAAESLH